MARYIKKHTRVGSMGPTEERGFAIWAGYDIVGVNDDLTGLGLINVEEWSDAQLAAHEIKTFKCVERDDDAMHTALGTIAFGIRRK